MQARNTKAIADWEAETGESYANQKSSDVDWQHHTSWHSAYGANEDVSPDVTLRGEADEHQRLYNSNRHRLDLDAAGNDRRQTG